MTITIYQDQTELKEEVGYVEFGLFSPEEIISMSSCEINKTKYEGTGSVYDERMGVSGNNETCVTCRLDSRECPGHFGYIELNHRIVHPLFYKTVLIFLKIFCFSCSKFLLSVEQIHLKGYNKLEGIKRFKKITKNSDKLEICWNCQTVQPVYNYNAPNSQITVHLKNDSTKHNLNVDDIAKIFDNIDPKDIELLGLKPEKSQPKWLIMSVLPVLPPQSRPAIIADGMTCDDDLTHKYVDIIKVNNRFKEDFQNMSETRKQKYIKTLETHIKILFDNKPM